MVQIVGGYDSNGFCILALGLLFGGAILNVIPNIVFKIIGVGFFVCGGVLSLGYVVFIVDTTPNLPSYANVIPLLFAIMLLLVVFKMIMFNYPTKKKDNSTFVDSSKDSTSK